MPNSDSYRINIKNYVWFFITGVMNAISLINIGKDFKPAIISWHQAFESIFEKYRQIVNKLFYPIQYVINMLLKIEIPDLIKHIFIFFFIFAAIIGRSRMLTDAQIEKSKKRQIDDYKITNIRDLLLFPLGLVAISVYLISFGLFSSFWVTVIFWVIMLVIGEKALSIVFLIFIAVTALFSLFHRPLESIEGKINTYWGISKEVESFEDSLMGKYTRNGFVSIMFALLIIMLCNFFLNEF